MLMVILMIIILFSLSKKQKIITNETRFFLEPNIIGVNKLFALVYASQDTASKNFKAKRYYLSRGVIESHNLIIDGKTFMSRQLIQM